MTKKLPKSIDVLPIVKGATKNTIWTGHSRTYQLLQKLQEEIYRLLMHNLPESGIICFERLPNGSYEINTYLLKK